MRAILLVAFFFAVALSWQPPCATAQPRLNRGHWERLPPDATSNSPPAQAHVPRPANTTPPATPPSARYRPTRAQSPPATAVADRQATPQVHSLWQRLADSVEGRPIEVAQFGTGARNLLIVGSLAGDEIAAVHLLDRLAEHLARFPQRLGDRSVTIVRSLNPDGFVRGTSANAHGVEIDRNFDAPDWRKVPHHGQWLSGRLPLSEPETRALVKIIADVRPERVIQIQAVDADVWLTASPGSELFARRISEAAGIELRPRNEATSSGSLLSWLAAREGIEGIALSVQRQASPEELWAASRGPLFQLMGIAPAGQLVARRGAPTEPTRPSTGPSQPAPPASRPNAVTARPVSQQHGTRSRGTVKQQPTILSADDLTPDAPLVEVIRPGAKPRRTNAKPSPRPGSGRSWLHPDIRRLPQVAPSPFAVSPTPYPAPQANEPANDPATIQSPQPPLLPARPTSPGRSSPRWPQPPIPFYEPAAPM